MLNKNSKSFTLIELLIVLALIAILATVLIVTIKPGTIFSRARDTKRINDLKNIERIMDVLYATESTFNELNYASSNVVYISLPDSSLTCDSWLSELPSLPSGWSYHCSVTPTNIDGTGWIPIPFSNFPILNISQLPIDPINKPPYYYSFIIGGSYKVTAKPEENYSPAINDGGIEPLLYEAGTDKKLSTFQSGLVLYLPFDEGSGTTARDLSGFGNNGTLCNEFTCGVQGPTWTTGKVGGALNFDGVDDFVSWGAKTQYSVPRISIVYWVMPAAETANYFHFNLAGSYTDVGTFMLIGRKVRFSVKASNVYDALDSINSLELNRWNYVAVTYDGTSMKIYLNGLLDKSKSHTSGGNISWSGDNSPWWWFGCGGGSSCFLGALDEVRIYNRALSDTEIKALYDATK
jgi:prepilin-type N-terminal cleavage/methylation domain-containing protein